MLCTNCRALALVALIAVAGCVGPTTGGGGYYPAPITGSDTPTGAGDADQTEVVDAGTSDVPPDSGVQGDASPDLPPTDMPYIESVEFFGQKAGQFPTFLMPLFGKTLPGGEILHAVKSAVVVNPTAQTRKVSLKAWLQGYSFEGAPDGSIELGPGESKQLAFDIPFDCSKLDGVSSDTTASYKLALLENGVELDARTATVQVLSKNRVSWLPPSVNPDTASIDEKLAAMAFMKSLVAALFTTKGDAWGEVDKLVAEATKLATIPLTGFGFDNLPEDKKSELAAEALRSIFKALKARGVNYSSVTNEFFDFLQNVRYPAESLHVGSQNCIDGSLVFASALERMGYEPVIVYVTGHAFVGARAGGGPLRLIETTMVASHSAEVASLTALTELEDATEKGDPHLLAVDIAATRKEGVLPSGFPCGAKPAVPPLGCDGNQKCVCEKSLDCKRSGKCTPSNGGCAALTNADCAKSTDCTDWGKCTATGNPATPCAAGGNGDCGQSWGCKKLGFCSASGGTCAATGSPTPGCNAADKVYIAKVGQPGSAEQMQYGSAANDCTLGQGCLAKSSDPAQVQCIAECIDASTPLSAGCAVCYGTYTHCAAKKCLSKCAADPDSSACKDCKATNCKPALQACTGVAAGPVCGNGQCEAGETASSCAQDCSLVTPGCNASDKLYISKIGQAGSAEQQQYAAAAKDCTLAQGCLAKSGDQAQVQCISDCIDASTSFSAGCASCYGAHSHCAVKKCLAQCAADPTSSACKTCTANNCDPALQACTGVASGPVCGNGTCEFGETSNNCAKDCPPPPVSQCGDGQCNGSESAWSCALDCDPKFSPSTVCFAQACSAEWAGCLNDTKCQQFFQCLANCKCDDACGEQCAAALGTSPPAALSVVGACLDQSACPDPCPSTSGHFCDTHCGKEGNGCFCDATCVQFGDCCDPTGTKAAGTVCAGSSCTECNP